MSADSPSIREQATRPSLRERLNAAAKRLVFGILARPRVLRVVFAVLRRVAPVLTIGRTVLVTRYRDIRSVLERPGDFIQPPSAAQGLPNGPFLFGMNVSPQYAGEKKLLQEAFAAADWARVGDLAGDEAQARIGALTEGRIDVVADLAVPVGLRLITDFLGVPAPADGNFVLSLRQLAQFVVTAGFDDPEEAARANRAALGVRRHVDAAIVQARAALDRAGAPDNTVLSRLLAAVGREDPEQGADVVRRNISGLLIFLHAPLAKGLAQAVDELFRHPAAVATARAAAAADDFDAVARHALEALRFFPAFPLLTRYAPRATGFVAINGRHYDIAADVQIHVAPLSGMFDSEAFPDPRAFKTDRPPEKYLVFGHGVHECFGRYIAPLALSRMMAALLKLRNLRRAPHGRGKFRLDGPAAIGLLLEFDP